MSEAKSENVLKFGKQNQQSNSGIARLFRYFLTPSGRTFSYYTIGAGACAAYALFSFPQTIFQEEYRDFIQAYE